MKNIIFLGLILCFLTGKQVVCQSHQSPMVLWYKQPAPQTSFFPYGENLDMYVGGVNGWREALPIGNGRMGAMIFGDVVRERIQLNEESLWDGFKRNSVNPQARGSLPVIRQLLFEGKADEASTMAESSLVGIPGAIKSFQSLGDLFIEFPNRTKEYTEYRRSLNIDSAIARVKFKQEGKIFTREMFASHPDQVIVLKFSCNLPGSLSMKISLNRERDAQSFVNPNDKLMLIQAGQINAFDSITGYNKGIKFETHVKIITTGGETSSGDGYITINGADEVILLVASATNYKGKNPSSECNRYLAKASGKSYNELLNSHWKDYTLLYNRTKIKLGVSYPFDKPTDQLLKEAREGVYSSYLSELSYQFGRYLLISSSRPGDLPANLQGVWCQHYDAPWNSDYHANINLQMNYWGAEVANLSECHEPLFDLIDSIAVYGRNTAKQMYNAGGWTFHHVTDIFWHTEPADGICGVWPMGGAWLVRHLWDRYLFTNDMKFLKNRAYPLMKGSAEFFLDFLVEIPEGLPYSGMLVTNPSHSPENAYEDENGVQSMFTYGATMDMQIIHDLFTGCIQAIDVINRDTGTFDIDFRNQLETTLNKLVPLQISKKTGKLQEWIHDYKEIELGHRHISHLYGVYPSHQISPDYTPELAEASILVLESRLKGNPNWEIEEADNKFPSFGSYLNDEGGGNWQRCWVTTIWARLYNPSRAFDSHRKQISGVLEPNFTGDNCAQLDGSFGITAAISEMLVQSHLDKIKILPALPDEWHSGKILGIKARGGFEIKLEWEKKKVKRLIILSSTDNKCKIELNGQKVVKVVSSGKKISHNSRNQVTEFNTSQNKVYEVFYK